MEPGESHHAVCGGTVPPAVRLRDAHHWCEVAPCPRKSAFLYVNRGLGTFGLPVRLGVPPEITVLMLRAAE